MYTCILFQKIASTEVQLASLNVCQSQPESAPTFAIQYEKYCNLKLILL